MKQKLLNNTLISNKTYPFYYESYLKLTNRAYNIELYSLNEFFIKKSFQKKEIFYKYFFYFNFTYTDYDFTQIITATLLVKDLINLNRIWRIVKGYSSYGQRTYSNGKMSRKNKLINTYRLNQFFQLFGHRKRNIYPTLIICEYTNKLWSLNWTSEWIESSIFMLRLVKSKVNKVPLDPVRLAKNFTNGYVRVGAASKLGKSKKITQVATIGYPIFFSRWLYYDKPPRDFP